MNTDSIIRHLVPFDARTDVSQPASIEDAKRILEKHPETSCLVIRQNGHRYSFEELLCYNRTCIDRSRNVFNSVKTLIRKHRIPIQGIRYLFHFKGDACELRPSFPLLSNSRNIGNDRIVLWPLLIKKNYLLSPTRYSPYLHDEITQFLRRPDKIPWESKAPIFFFRGRNSGNPYCSVQYPWNRFRHSRGELLAISQRLPEDLRPNIDVGFNELYPKRKILIPAFRNPSFLEKQFGQYLRDGCSLTDLEGDIEFSLSHIKPELSRSKIYRFKYQLCPEGFDCSSALSWVLASNCLAVVPPFHYENAIINSSALKPYEHFLPISEDYGDLPDAMRWALTHEDECRQMVANANAYVRPFVDEEYMAKVQKTILARLLSTGRPSYP